MAGPMSPHLMDGRHRGGFVRQHSLLCFFLLTFGLSWAGMLAAVLVSPGGLTTTPEQLQGSLGVAIAGMLLGPLVAGVVMTWLVSGRGGFHELRRRLTRWRVGLRWYAFALLVAPVAMAGTLLVISVVSQDFLPRIGAEQDRLPLLLMGLAVGVTVGFCEEIGWTGFAVPRMRLRRGVLGTGLALGIVWGFWHLLQGYYASGVTSHEISLAVWAPLWVLACLVGQLVAYRVLMVWVYERTGGSLLLAIVMHASLAGSTLIFFPPLSVVANQVGGFATAAAFWAVVGIVALTHGGHLSTAPATPSALQGPAVTAVRPQRPVRVSGH
jgi:membrane protease YdiL (CAAX protease family)